MELDAILVVEDGRSSEASRHIVQAGIPALVVSGAVSAYDRMHRNSFQAVLLTPSADVGPLEFALNAREIHDAVPIVVARVSIDEAEQGPLDGMKNVLVVDGEHREFAENALDALAGMV